MGFTWTDYKITLATLLFTSFISLLYCKIDRSGHYINYEYNIQHKSMSSKIQVVTTLWNDTETKAEMMLSPTRVMRAILAHAIQMKLFCITIITEIRFEFIAREWKQFLMSRQQIFIAGLIVLRNDSIAESLKHMSSNTEFCLHHITVILLKTNKLGKLYGLRTHIESLLSPIQMRKHWFVIIGKCPPKFLRELDFYHQINIMILPVNTDKWIHGIVDRRSLPLHSIYHKKKNVRITYPLQSMDLENYSRTKMQPNDNLYGSLKNVIVHATIYPQPGIIDKKNEELSGFLGELVIYLKDYLKFTIINTNLNDIDMKYDMKLGHYFQIGDIQIGAFIIGSKPKTEYLPVIMYDGISIFAAKIDSPITIETLLSIFKWKVWILLFAIIWACNLCFFYSFDASPYLKNHPRVKNRYKTAFWQIVSFDSLIAFQMEWGKGPNLSSKWLLLSFNILFYFTSTFFLIIFSVRVLSDKRHFPFKDINDIWTSKTIYAKLAMDASTSMNIEHCFLTESVIRCGARCVEHNFNGGELDRIINGTWALMTSTYGGSDYFKHIPSVHKFPIPLCRSATSIQITSEFLFAEVFSRFILRLREHGMLQILRRRYPELAEKNDAEFREMTFSETWFSFMICGIGIIATFFFLVIELVMKHSAH